MFFYRRGGACPRPLAIITGSSASRLGGGKPRPYICGNFIHGVPSFHLCWCFQCRRRSIPKFRNPKISNLLFISEKAFLCTWVTARFRRPPIVPACQRGSGSHQKMGL